MKKYFFIIFALGLFLRSYQILDLPALNADEAALGYNAYSLLETGKDEHGNSWPIHFQSFNDYKPGFYVYLLLPIIKVLGMNTFAVRLPGIIFGVGSIVLIYFLVKQLFPNKPVLALISMLFLSISPWHIHFSRGGWEVNVATFFILLGVLGLLKGFKNYRWLIVSIFAFAFSLYTYHAARIVVPFLVLGLIIFHFKDVFKKAKIFSAAALIGVLLITPLAINLLGPAGLSRAAGVGLFADTGPYWRTNEQRGEHNDIIATSYVAILHNKIVNYSLTFLSNYFSHFSGNFLFISGDEIQRNKVPEFGQMYLVDIVFLIFGVMAIFQDLRKWKVIVLWLVISPLAAALTFQTPHALRAQNMVIPLTIITAFGVYSFFSFIKGKVSRKHYGLILSLVVLLYLWDFTRYFHQYFTHMAKTYDYSSQYGFKEVADYLKENQEKYNKIIITDRYDQPYILTLFYLKYDPKTFQEEQKLTPRDQYGFSTVRDFGKYTFVTPSPWDKISGEYRGALIIGTDEEIPDATNIQKIVRFPSGRIAYKIVAN